MRGLALFIVAVALLGVAGIATASENDPMLGGCISKNTDGSCKLSAHPAVLSPLTAIDLKDGKVSYGMQAVALGACYGVTYEPSKWYASGASFCLNTYGGQGVNTTVFPSGVLQLVGWGAVGVGGKCVEGSDGMYCHAILLFGVNVPIQ